ncbi:MAG: VanZ family protein [Bacteroidales bacterium]|nr:VanZ family protein [Bacteroidales bacterium]
MILKYYKTILVLLFVLLLSLLPAETTSKIRIINIPHFDKLIHFFMYFLLTSASLIDIKNNIKVPTSVLILSVLLSLLFLSGIIEIIQEFFIFGRNGSFFDLTANLIGITISSLLFYKTSIFSKFLQDS